MRVSSIVRGVVVTVAILAIVVAAFLLYLQTRLGGEWLGRVAAGQLERYVDGEVSIGRIQGSLFSSATLHDVVISREGTPLITVKQMSAAYDLGGMLGGGDLAFDDILLVEPVIRLTRGPDGTLDVSELFGADRPAADPNAPARRLSIAPIVIRDGRVIIGPTADRPGGIRVPNELNDVDARLAIDRAGDDLSVQIDHLSFKGDTPEFTLAKLSGGIRYTGSDLTFDALTVQTARNHFIVNGAIENVTALGES